jgi:hypothetical protein
MYGIGNNRDPMQVKNNVPQHLQVLAVQLAPRARLQPTRLRTFDVRRMSGHKSHGIAFGNTPIKAGSF